MPTPTAPLPEDALQPKRSPGYGASWGTCKVCDAPKLHSPNCENCAAIALAHSQRTVDALGIADIGGAQ